MIRRLQGRLSTDLVIVLVLFAGLVAFSAYTTARRPEQGGAPPCSTHSTASSGTAALYLWLEELGYRVRRIENGPFRVAHEARLLFVLAPSRPFDDTSTRLVQSWLEEPGHTLVLVVEWGQGTDLAQSLGARILPLPTPAELLTPTVPLLINPPPGPVRTATGWGLHLERTDFVSHLQAGQVPVLVSLSQGQGRVFLTTAVAPFTNAGLRDPGSARLIYNLVAGLEPGALIQFDEVHHGYSDEQEDRLLSWLFRSPWGWALLYSAAVTLGWIVLHGRRFGRPIPLAEQVRRRPQSEYVVSMARLFRRAGRRTFVLRHNHDRLKRELARPWRINPDLPDDLFVDELARCHDSLDAAALRNLLARLSAGQVSEKEMVHLVGQVEKWILPDRGGWR